MSKTTVVHVSKSKYDIYIGRANGDLPQSKWANPWVIGKDGTRDEVIQKYEEWIKTQSELMAALPELKGKVLGCWCKPANRCHGDVLARLVQEQMWREGSETFVAAAKAAPIEVKEALAAVIKEPTLQVIGSAPLFAVKPILPVFTSMYSYGESILSVEEAGKTEPGQYVSIVDLARQHHLKQVIIVDSRMDGVLEAQKNLSKPFKATIPKSLEDYQKEARGEKAATEESRAKGLKMFEQATAKYEREKDWFTEPIQLVFGLKLTVVPDMSIKTPESRVNESSVILFMKDAVPTSKSISASYKDLVKINNVAWTIGKYEDEGRIDWKTLKTLFTPNLTFTLPFFSSFISRNLLTMATIVPDLPAVPWVFREIDSQLPFAPLIDQAIDQYVAANPATVQPIKSVYYAGSGSSTFVDYTLFRARSTRSKGKSGTFSAPGVDNMSSDRFSLAAWKEITA